jgi:NAD(P)-dependent dehydrogenase (short-subunit alcohol dehydrogenase family)
MATGGLKANDNHQHLRPGRLEGKRIIITGAVDNIGKGAVRLFLDEGARVVIGDIDELRGRAVAAEFGADTHFLRVDLASEDEIRSFIEAGVAWLGGLDVLCQNAGIQAAGKVTEFSTEQWDRIFAINVRAQFLGAKYAVPHLRRSGKGSIVNMASIAGLKGGAGLSAYSASKGACVMLTNSLARELGRDNIRVNAICPGWVDTPFNSPAIANMGGRDVQEAAIKAGVPLGRQSTPAEIAPLYVYLASDESSFMTGQALLIDGGVHN